RDRLGEVLERLVALPEPGLAASEVVEGERHARMLREHTANDVRRGVEVVLLVRAEHRRHEPAGRLVVRRAGRAADDQHRGVLLIGDGAARDAGLDVHERAGGCVDLLAVDGKASVALQDDVQLLLAGVRDGRLAVLVDDLSAGLDGTVGIDAEALDAEVLAHLVADAPVADRALLDLVDRRDRESRLRGCHPPLLSPRPATAPAARTRAGARSRPARTRTGGAHRRAIRRGDAPLPPCGRLAPGPAASSYQHPSGTCADLLSANYLYVEKLVYGIVGSG